jgi:4-amino-4-deoxy-L-arabinose transferase and related glycosyltransferases of PMT family
MAAGAETAGRLSALLRRVTPRSGITALLVVWPIAVVGLGAVLALRMNQAGGVFGTTAMLWVLAVISATCVGSTLVARRFRPEATLPTALGMGAAIVVGGAAATDGLAASLPVIALVGFSWFIGDAIVSSILPTPAYLGARVVVGIALGIGVTALLLLLLASLGILNTATVAGGGIVIALAVWSFGPRRGRWGSFRSFRPAVPSWFEAFVAAVAIALVAYALLQVFVPEETSDAVRLHLPIAREIWQHGSAPNFPILWPSAFPIGAHIIYAPEWGLGGTVAVKMTHAAVGLLAIGSVGALAWLLAGRSAALVASVIFGTMPIVLWELGHADVDLFPTMFIAASSVAILLWLREERRGWLVAAGALVAFAFAAKMSAGVAGAALAVAILLVGRRSWQARDRALAIAAFCIGAAVVLPWLVRSYVLTGSIAGLDILAEALRGNHTGLTVGVAMYGIGRTPLDLARLPWEMTFNGVLFGEGAQGSIGILLLLTLPLIALNLRNRAVALICVATAVAFVGWAFTAQYFRYGLPMLALAAALGGSGFASAIKRVTTADARFLARTTPAFFAIGLVLTGTIWVPSWWNNFLPVGLFSGQQTRDDFLSQRVSGYAMLQKATVTLPEDTLVGWVGLYWPDQIYTEALMTPISVSSLGTSPGDVAANLQSLGIHYIIWDRPYTVTADWHTTALSTGFLRDYAKILGASNSDYFIETYDTPSDRWGMSHQNLLHDSDLSVPGAGWFESGPVQTVPDGRILASGAAIRQRVPASPNGPYTLVAEVSCAADDEQINLALSWLDDQGVRVGLTWELLKPGTDRTDQFVWAEPPDRTTQVDVSIASWEGSTCTVANVDFEGPR